MRHSLTIVLCALMFFVISGCAIFNPYEEDFACKAGKETGKCVTIKDAYNESLQDETQNRDTENYSKITRRGRVIKDKNRSEPKKGENETKKTGELSPDVEITYQKRAFKKLSGMLEKPVTPLMSPPTVMRVLFLPYKDAENRLYMSRYVYFIVDEPQWVIGGSSPEGDEATWEY